MTVREYAFYMVWDAESRVWVTHVPDLNDLSLEVARARGVNTLIALLDA